VADDAVARFEDIHRRAFGPLTAYALRRGSPHDAADVVAETLLVAWRRLDELPPAPDDVPWLFGVARRVLSNQRRSSTRRSALVERLAVEIAPAVRPVEPDGSLAAAMAGLRDDQREVLRLVVWEGLTTSQLAVALGCTPNAAAARLHRARWALRVALDSDERTGPSWTGLVRRPTDA
jgi:RNA polymerase sigma-70 factor (ECF subfamily)